MACNNLHITTINTQGLRDKQKRNRLYEWVKQQKAKLVLVQETHFTEEMLPFIRTEWAGEIIHSIGTSSSRGVSIFIHKTLNAEIIDKLVDKEGRYIVANIKVDENVYCITNIYAPNDIHKRNSFIKQMKAMIENKSQGYNIIGGDWNDIQEVNDRKSRNTRIQLNPNFKQLKKHHNLFDPWKFMNKTKRQFPWKRKNSTTEASRIDYFLIQSELKQKNRHKTHPNQIHRPRMHL